MPFRTPREEGDGRAASRRRDGARDRTLARLLADDDHNDA
jgi:hypothetical protein